jgi:phospholipid/cholesterol/gamma-HCH transport system ATP-binding protein
MMILNRSLHCIMKSAKYRNNGMMKPVVTFENVYFAYDREYILNGIDFVVYEGQMAIFIGENGSGKSTIFKLIAGLLKPDKGRILIDTTDITTLPEDELNEVRKNMGIIFQESALFDSLLVGENIAYPMHERLKLPDSEIQERIIDMLKLVELEAAFDKYPSELSGGMKKRVAIARALASFPRILLYDDPTAGLDPITARTILKIVIKLRDIKNITSLLITNQFEEAMTLSALKAEQRDHEIVYNSIEGGNPDCVFFLLENGIIATAGDFCNIQQSPSSYIQQYFT